MILPKHSSDEWGTDDEEKDEVVEDERKEGKASLDIAREIYWQICV